MTEIGFIQALPMGALGDNRTSVIDRACATPRCPGTTFCTADAFKRRVQAVFAAARMGQEGRS